MKIIKKPVSELNPAAYNPRKDLKPGDPEYEKLKKSMVEFDCVEPIVWNEASGNVVGGHQRLKILIELGHEDIDVSVVNLDNQKEKALNIALNKISGEWDQGKLEDLIKELSVDADFDLELTGFDLDELSAFIDDTGEPADAEPQIDQAEELNKKWMVKSGDLWEIGEHRLLCGDSTKAEDVERVMGGEKAAAIVTDPPYGIGADKKKAHSSIRDSNSWADVTWDKKPGIEHIRTMVKFADRVAIWGGNYFTDGLPVSSGWLAWVKPQYGTGFSLSDMELCWTNQDIGPRCKEFGRRDGHDHPTQKPVDLITWTIDKIDAKGNGAIVDFYLGSGTTMVACENLNRKCRGIEISENYCAVILERMSTAFPKLTIHKAIQ